MYDEYIFTRDWAYSLQTSLDSPLHLKNYMILRGEAAVSEIKSGNLSVNLEHMTTVLKLKLTLPTPDLTLNWARIGLKNADGSDGYFASMGWGYLKELKSFPIGGHGSYVYLNLGSHIQYGAGTGLTVSGSNATLYIPMVLYEIAGKMANSEPETLTIKSGQKFEIGVMDGSYQLWEQALTFTSDKDLEPGKLYTIHSSPVAL